MIILHLKLAILFRFSTLSCNELCPVFLRPYSPELNPDELAWNVIKGQASGRSVVEDKQTLRRLVRGALRRLQRSTEKLKKLFHEPNVAYILDECRV